MINWSEVDPFSPPSLSIATEYNNVGLVMLVHASARTVAVYNVRSSSEHPYVHFEFVSISINQFFVMSLGLGN